MTPKEELLQRNILKVKYHEKFSALVQYLYEDDIKTTQARQEDMEKINLEEDLENLLIENDKINQEVAERRKQRIEEQTRRKKEEAERKVKEEEEKKKVRREQLKMLIEREKQELEKAVKDDAGLERAIAEVLDNPVDHEFAIDLEGHIYKGRYTKSILVPEDQREKIPEKIDHRDVFQS